MGGAIVLLIIGICIFNFVRAEVRSREEAELYRKRKEQEFQKQMEHTRKVIEDANRTALEFNKNRLSQEFPITEFVTEQQYQKAIRAIETIDNEKIHLQNKLKSTPMDNEVARWEIIQDLQVLNDLRRKIGSTIKNFEEEEKIVVGLREELGENWYREWKKLFEDTENIQRYVEGAAYEIVFGLASIKDFL